MINAEFGVVRWIDGIIKGPTKGDGPQQRYRLWKHFEELYGEGSQFGVNFLDKEKNTLNNLKER